MDALAQEGGSPSSCHPSLWFLGRVQAWLRGKNRPDLAPPAQDKPCPFEEAAGQVGPFPDLDGSSQWNMDKDVWEGLWEELVDPLAFPTVIINVCAILYFTNKI